MPSRCLFIDMNAFYASVEQQERVELRGKPVIVVPLRAESTCAIAAFYEAKRWGIQTGTSVYAQRGGSARLCVLWRHAHPFICNITRRLRRS